MAPAKINLTLRVVGRLPNGYHELDTWMHKVQLFDEIVISPSQGAGIHLRCPDSGLPEDETNLVHRAAKRFFDLIHQAPAVDIILKKNIPISAGLGGGSSDCATTLIGLNTLYGVPLSKQVLLEEGKRLGADVPFFIEEYGSARAQGIGELLSPLPSLPICHILLVNPNVAVSTGWVFSMLKGKIPELDGYQFDSQKTSKKHNYALTSGAKTYILSRASGEGHLPHLYNDLEEITMAAHPEIAFIKNVLKKFNPVSTLMSGSGSTVFGIFADINQAMACKNKIQSAHRGWCILLCEPFI